MIKEDSKNKKKQTFTGLMRKIFSQPLEKIGGRLHRWGISANMITITGLVGTMVGAFLASQGKLLVGGLVMMAMGALDGLDGPVARASGENKDVRGIPGLGQRPIW